MKPFIDVSAALLVGTRRWSYTRSGYLDELRCDSTEKTALVEAGLLDLMRRAGVSPSSTVQSLATAPIEQRPIAHASAEPLKEAIDLGLRDILIEWAKAAALQGKVAPHPALAKIIEWLPKDREELLPILGTRGRGLADLIGLDIGVAETSRTPAELRSWLQAEWEQLDWKQRVEGITRLEPDLSGADEPLLSIAIKDRRREVRDLAVKLLARLDDSAFAREIRETVRGRIRLERKLLSKHLAVPLPDPADLPASLPRTSPRQTFGPKAHALFDLLRLVRPSFWEQETGLTPADLITMAAKTEYKEVLMSGWLVAASEIHMDQRWIDAFFRYYESGANPAMIRTLGSLAFILVFEEVYRSKLKSNGYLPSRATRFSPGFSKLVVEAVKQQTISVDKEMERCLDPSVLPSLREPWDSKADSMREHWYRSLDLRQRLG